MMKRAALLVLGMVLWSGPAHAQLFDIHLGPRVGMFTPLGALLEDDDGVETKISSGVGLGASIELDIPFSPINVRANVDAALNRSLEIDGQKLVGSEIDVIALTGDLVFRPLPRILVVQPYLLAGAGIKKYSANDANDAIDGESDFTGHVGIGADLRAGPVSLLAEISDYISSFELGGNSKLQNDVFVMVGLRIGLL
jgi:hypothetical protein